MFVASRYLFALARPSLSILSLGITSVMDVGLKSAGWDSTFSKLEVLLIFASSCESGTVVARVTLMGVRSEQTQRVLVKANTRPVPLRLEFQPEALFSTQSALWLPSKVQVQCTPGHTFDFEFLASTCKLLEQLRLLDSSLIPQNLSRRYSFATPQALRSI